MKRKAPTQRSNTRWTDADTQRLRDGLDRLSVTLDEAAFGKVVQWAMLLKQWNRTYNLLGNSESTHLIDEHLLDSLAIVPVLARYLPQLDEALVDVGTGAGFPGILLAIVQPQRPIYLVEPVGKKVAFLRQSVLTLGLKNATVLAGKIEDLESLLHADRVSRKGSKDDAEVMAASGNANAIAAEAADIKSAPQAARDASPAAPPLDNQARHGLPSPRHAREVQAQRGLPRPPHFICRAFTALGRFATLCEPYMSEDSLLFAMKSLRLSEEQQALPASVVLRAVEPLPTIDLGVQRNLAILGLATTVPIDGDTEPSTPQPTAKGTPSEALATSPEQTRASAPSPASAHDMPSSTSQPSSAQPNRRRPQ